MAPPASSVIANDQLQLRRMLKHGTPLPEQEREAALTKIAAAAERLQELAGALNRDLSLDLYVGPFIEVAQSYSDTANKIAEGCRDREA